jgi:hypothetical protein
MPYRKALLTALTVGAVLAIIVGTASARRLEFSNQAFRAVFPGGTSTEEFNVVCAFTLEGSFHSRTITKMSGQLVGFISRATLAEATCSGGRSRFLTENLPWHIRYDSFTGTLPSITGTKFQVGGWGIQSEYTILPGVLCLYLTSGSMPTRFTLIREAGGSIEPLRLDEASSINKFSGGIGCPASMGLGGNLTFRVLGSTTTKISVRLVQ